MAKQGCCTMAGIKRFVWNNLLMTITLLSVILGFAIGFGLREVELSDIGKMWLEMPGYCFINLLRLTVLPLITVSLITAVATMKPRENGKLGAIHIAYIVSTNIMGSTIGTCLGVALQKTGEEAKDQGRIVLKSQLQPIDVFADLIRNFFPTNIVQLTIQKVQTKYREKEVDAIWDENGTVLLKNATVSQERYLEYVNSMNILGLMVVCVVFGLAASAAGEKGKPFISFFASATEVILIMLRWFIWVAPLGILFLMIVAIAAISDLEETFSKVGYFVLAVVCGIGAHQLIFVPLIYFVATRKNPFRLYPYMSKSWLVAFATTSTACAMPYMYKLADEPKVGWNPKVTRFTIPLAVALNKDGSALFICNSCFFMAQLTGTDLNVTNIFLIWFLATVTTLALPSIPSSSLVLVVIICGATGIPITHIGLLFTVEWLLDRLRTSSNNLSQMFSIGFVNKFYQMSYKDEFDSLAIEKLHSMDEKTHRLDTRL